MRSITTTCPQEIRKDNRQAHNREREQTPERKAAVKVWCIGKTCTCGCGRPANCAHHPTDDLYQDEWANLDECDPWQSFCHHMHHKGFVRCPKCGGWMRPGKEACSKCRGSTIRKPSIKHPCDRRKPDQKCARKPGMVCEYSAAKAKTNCSYFKERKKP
jgi:hypothetical protein